MAAASTDAFRYSFESAKAAAKLLESFARNWARRNGKTTEYFYTELLKGITKGDAEVARAVGMSGDEAAVRLSARKFAEALNNLEVNDQQAEDLGYNKAVVAAFPDPGHRALPHEFFHVILDNLPKAAKDKFLKSIGEMRDESGRISGIAQERFVAAAEDALLRGGKYAPHQSLIPVYDQYRQSLRHAYPIFNRLTALRRKVSTNPVYWDYMDRNGTVYSGLAEPFNGQMLMELPRHFDDVSDLP